MFNQKQIVMAMLIALPCSVVAQLRVSGKIKNKTTAETIAGAVIGVENTYITTTSKADGTYELAKLKEGKYVVYASFLGYQKYTDTIELSADTPIDIMLTESTVLMDEVIVSATRVGDKSAMAYSNVSKKQIAEQNLGQDLPYLLNMQQSVVTTSDAGAGVGYTGIRIRGVDATRVNVTINGVPVNDAESQGTFWVNLPDFASSVDNIQIQRGVGTSTNGAGAFGGSINIETNKLSPSAYAEYNTSYGSFNTLKNTVNVGSGLINDKFTFDARLSKITSDGFIDRASSDLKSYYLSGAYYGKKTIVKFIHFAGLEKTYQSWYGIPEVRLKGDAQGMNNYIINNGLDAEEATNLLNSNGRTYNYYSYNNQIDHYQQNYYQLHLSHELNKYWNANVALHYTKGFGYYEEYKKKQSLSNYGLNDVIIGSDTVSSTNLVRRRWLDNDFVGTTFSLNYNNHKKLSAIVGGAYNKYVGTHFGEIIWSEFASNGNLNHRYYNDSADKTDFNVFVKANYLITQKLNVFADVQYRTVNYSFLGFNSQLMNVNQTALLNFVNPKIGFNYDLSANANVYASYSVGNKEPSREDYTQSTPESRPKHETLNDVEAGYKHATKKAMWSINAYWMDYKNQLVLTGGVNDVGSYNRVNVAKSYRQGIEAAFGIKILKNFDWNMNATFSQNKINNFEELVVDYDNGGQQKVTYSKTDIAFSPNVIAGNTFTYEPIKNLKFSFLSKYVGEQFLDNTSTDTRKLDAFFVNDFRINYSFKTKYIRTIGITLALNNLFGEQYESNGYTYGYIYGGQRIVENFYYPQAGTNYLLGLTFKF